MDDGLKGQYMQFLKSNAGIDLINRLKLTEANYMMQGMKSQTMEGRGIAMTKMSTVYEVRTMLDDLSKPQEKKEKEVRKSKPISR